MRFADYRDPDAFEKLIDARTKAVFCESIGNPLGNITDFARLADIAHANAAPLIVDNTVPSPYLCRPFDHGADIVVHSLTKYLGGHGNSIGGIIVDSGKFPWAQHKAKFRRLNEPDVSYHGVVYTEALGPAAYIARARVVPLRNMGAAISPFNAFLILQGIETVALRMDRICENTLKVAGFLQKHAKVTWVNYAGLPDHKDHALVQRYMGGRASGILTFGVKGGREAGARFQDALKLVRAAGQYRRLQVARVPSRFDDTPPAVARRARESRRHRGNRSTLDRHRAYRGHHLGSRAGAVGGLSATRFTIPQGDRNGSIRAPSRCMRSTILALKRHSRDRHRPVAEVGGGSRNPCSARYAGIFEAAVRQHFIAGTNAVRPASAAPPARAQSSMLLPLNATTSSARIACTTSFACFSA